MADMPGRSAPEQDDRAGGSGNGSGADGGWGSPVPAEYGSLRSVRPPDTGPGPGADGSSIAERWGVPSFRRRRAGGEQADGDRAGGPAAAAATPASDPARHRDGPADSRPVPAASVAGDQRPGDQRPGDQRPGDQRPDDPGDQLTDFERLTAPAPRYRADGAGTDTDWAASDRTTSDRSGADRSGADGAGLYGAGPYGGRPGGSGAAGGAAAVTAALDQSAGPAVPADLPTATVPAVGGGLFTDGEPAMGGGPVVGGPFPGPPGARRRPGRRRSRATIRHIDVLTVLRVSLIFYLVVLIVFVVASLFLWLAADTFGSLPSIEKSVRTLFSLKSFTLHPGAVAFYTGASGVVLAVAGTLWNVLLAFMYNLIADVVGGVRVELESFTKE